MDLRIVYNLFSLTTLAGFAFLVGACTKSNSVVQVRLIQPTGGHCAYTVSAATLSTLENLSTLRGSVGSVVFLDENLDARPEILDEAKDFRPVDVSFTYQSGVHHPLDFTSLFAASLYYAVERGYLLFTSLDPELISLAAQSRFSETLIIHEGRRTLGDFGVDPEVTDNGEFRPHRVKKADGSVELKNYLLSYPTVEVTGMPLGMNMGIMVHEYSHLIFNALFDEPRRNLGLAYSSRSTATVVRSFDEGLADYFGFLSTDDPGYFLCTFPSEDRDISKAKYMTDSMQLSLEGDRQFDPHTGGAVWASALYQIGLNMPGGHAANARSLIRLMRSLTTCGSVGSSDLVLDFETIANCHLSLMSPSDNPSNARQIYSQTGILRSGGVR